jgi:hypothetical protein
MRWLYLTLGLLATSVCLVGWIYLRDRDTSSYLPPGPTERQLAQIDATATLNHLAAWGRHVARPLRPHDFVEVTDEYDDAAEEHDQHQNP